MSRQECPTVEELRAFGLGNLPETQLEAVARHLDGCSRCEERVRVFDRTSDPAIESLRGLRRTNKEKANPGKPADEQNGE